MATVLRTVCDVHLADDAEHAAEAVTITVGGTLVPADVAGPHILDVCPVAYDEYVKPFLAFLAEHGRADEQTMHDAGIPCPHCDKTFRYRKRYEAHLTSKHGQPETDEAGDTLVCRIGGCDREFTGPRAPQARGGHEHNAHKRRA